MFKLSGTSMREERRAALGRFVRAIAPGAIADGRLPTDSRMLLHLLEDQGPPLAGKRGRRWAMVLQNYLTQFHIEVRALDVPLVWVAAVCQEAGCGDGPSEVWTWLLDELGRL